MLNHDANNGGLTGVELGCRQWSRLELLNQWHCIGGNLGLLPGQTWQLVEAHAFWQWQKLDFLGEIISFEGYDTFR